MYGPTREYQKMFKVSSTQLRHWANTGQIDHIRTPGGTRLYRLEGTIPSDPVVSKKVAYVRVSSNEQRSDLQHQKDHMASLFPEYRIVEDVGSGINWKRPGLLSVLDDALKGRLSDVAVANRDRLCRFAFELLQHVLEGCGVRLHVVDDTDSEERELADDLLFIVQVFCCRRNGRRRYKKSPEDDENPIEPDDVAETRPREVPTHSESGVERNSRVEDVGTHIDEDRSEGPLNDQHVSVAPKRFQRHRKKTDFVHETT